MARTLVRWEPGREMLSLRDAMDRLLGESFIRPRAALDTFFGGQAPALDMHETDDQVVVEASIPGVKLEEIDIQVTGNVLTIKGERKEEKTEEKANYIYREQAFGSFCRSVTLPSDIDVEKAQAQFEHGVLTLTLPKVEAVKPKSIKVKSVK